MRHRRKTAKLGVTTSHRRAMLAHIVEGLVEHQRIRTTVDRAKEARRLAEHLITLAKRNTLHARRQVVSALYSENIARRLFERVAPAFSDVKGGYTRIIRDGNRPGDGAQMVFLELTKAIELEEPKPRPKIKGKSEVKPEQLKKEKKKWESITPVKKERIEEKKEKKQKKEEKAEVEKPEEEKKKGGFLTTLRKFLKGDK